MASFTKQPYEAFTIQAEFKKNMVASETLSDADVTAMDINETDVTSSIIGTVTINNTNVMALIQAGTVTGSPYKITFRVTTSSSHKWEMDVIMRIVEDRDV